MRSIGAGIVRIYKGAGRASRAVCIFVIRGYQKTARFRPPMCRFQPSCSEYMAQAIQKYGVLKGFCLGFWRILKCNPFHPGGYDPIK